MQLPLQKPKTPRALWAVLAAALLLRLALAGVTQGYPYDLSCFLAWGDRMAAQGPYGFYAEGYFADYPPGYLWVLGLVALVRRALGAAYDGHLAQVLLALPPALCDAGIAWLVWQVAARAWPQRPQQAMRMAAFAAFCPLLLFDTAVWKQIDGAFALPLLVCFWLLEQKRYLPAAVFYGLALAIKPQALLAGPVLAAAYLAAVADARAQGRAAVGRAAGRIFGGAALALAPPLLVGLPFFGPARLLPGLWEKYFGTATSYPYATINGFNLLAALGGNWQPLDGYLTLPLAGGIPLLRWGTLGAAGIALATLALAVLAVRSWRAGRFSPLLLAGFYTAALFTLAYQMHERYIVLGALLVLLAAARWGDRRLYGAGFGFSLTGLIDLAAVYTLVGTEDEWMTSATSQLVVRLTGLAEVACFLLLAVAAWDLATPRPAGETGAGADAPDARRLSTGAARGAARPAPPPWTRREAAALLGLTAATALLSFAYLGDTTAPQNAADANGGAHTATVALLPGAPAPAELWAYPGISTANNGLLTVTDAAGAEAARYELGYTAPFTWARLDMSAAGPGPYTITVTDGAILELCFRDAAGGQCPLEPAACADPMFDEQALVPEAISQLNSFYFDEIYHARTGYETLHGLPIYETTHPPLGKDLIMLGIALFGMTGFGWRFSGTLFGVLLVPLAWCFARRLARQRWVGALAGALLALDLMRFAQSRIATIDTYATFFILLGAHCMLWYCQSVLEKGVLRSFAPMALGGLAFGLGCAAKWTGIYAGAGLAALYLGVLWARWQQKPPDFRAEFRAAALGGVTFYIVVPLGVYIASYLPYTWGDPGFGLGELWQAQLSMFRYHSGLESTHPFESRWYTWLLGLRPVWYYSNGGLPAGWHGTIAGLAGPAIWVAGLGCILLLLWRQASGRATPEGAAVLILYATQLMPWMLVTRCTFLYHYFPSSQFCLAAVALVLAQMPQQRRAKRLGAGLCLAALAVFIAYYPAVSGLPVPEAWIDALKVLPSFGF